MKQFNTGDRVVLSNHPDAQVYTINKLYWRKVGRNTRWFSAELTYVSEYGRHCNAGAVDVSLLMTPSDEQLFSHS